MANGKTIQQKVSDTLLQRPQTVSLGGKEYQVAPPSIGTLIYVSGLISQMPKIEIRPGKENQDILSGAKDCGILPEIIAVLILGIKDINSPLEGSKKGLFGGKKRKIQTKYNALVKELRENVTPAEIKTAIVPLLESLQLADFFVITTFLNGINITKPTKVETGTGATASGQ